MRYVALLRAINVGTANRVKMADLVAALNHHGIEGATTYLQSGNVLFDWSRSSHEAEEAFGKALAELNLKSHATLRTAGQMREIAAVSVFERRSEPEKLHFVTFLPSNYDGPLESDPFSEVLWRTPTEVFWLAMPREGKAPTGPKFPTQLQAHSTTRNWIVTRALAKLLTD